MASFLSPLVIMRLALVALLGVKVEKVNGALAGIGQVSVPS